MNSLRQELMFTLILWLFLGLWVKICCLHLAYDRNTQPVLRESCIAITATALGEILGHKSTEASYCCKLLK